MGGVRPTQIEPTQNPETLAERKRTQTIKKIAEMKQIRTDQMNQSWDTLKDSLGGAGWVEPTLEQTGSDGEVLIGQEVYVMVCR